MKRLELSEAEVAVLEALLAAAQEQSSAQGGVAVTLGDEDLTEEAFDGLWTKTFN